MDLRLDESAFLDKSAFLDESDMRARARPLLSSSFELLV
jgi:hypothetical protein